MLPKFDELVALCSAEHPDIICLVETWLCEDILDSEVSIPNYSIVRLDRCRHGGGVALFIHNSVLYNVILSDPTGLELIVSLSRINFKLYLGVFYRPPSSPPAIFELLCTSLFQSVHQSYFSNFVILGDFSVDFTTSHPLYPFLFDFMSSFCLTQVVDSPTHFSPAGKPTLIDLVFVSNVRSCFSCSTIPPLANSDHLGLSLSVKKDCTSTTPPPRHRVWRYKHADFERANELLCDLNLDSILDHTNIQTSWRQFKSAFLEIMEQCVPRSLVPDRKNLPWLSKAIIQLIRKRNYYFNLACRTGNPADRQKFKHLRNKVVSRLHIAKQNYFSKFHPKNQKEFWKILRSINKKDCSIPPLTSGSFIAASSSDKANLLNATFSSYFNRAVPELSPSDLPKSVPDVCPEDILCSEDEVYELLCSLDTTKGSGDDDISAIMLKATVLSVTSAVTQLFNISLKLGEIPEDWKVARVIPIPKSHGKSDPGNYRPISLLSVLSKLLESICATYC